MTDLYKIITDNDGHVWATKDSTWGLDSTLEEIKDYATRNNLIFVASEPFPHGLAQSTPPVGLNVK